MWPAMYLQPYFEGGERDGPRVFLPSLTGGFHKGKGKDKAGPFLLYAMILFILFTNGTYMVMHSNFEVQLLKVKAALHQHPWPSGLQGSHRNGMSQHGSMSLCQSCELQALSQDFVINCYTEMPLLPDRWWRKCPARMLVEVAGFCLERLLCEGISCQRHQ